MVRCSRIRLRLPFVTTFLAHPQNLLSRTVGNVMWRHIVSWTPLSAQRGVRLVQHLSHVFSLPQ